MNSRLIFCLIWILSQTACSPLFNQATSADYLFRGAKLSLQPKFADSLELKKADLVAQLTFLETPVQADRPTRIALRFWKLGQSGEKSVELVNSLQVAVKPPSGRCDGCFVSTDHLLVLNDPDGPFYVLPDVSFHEAGTWTFRVVLKDPSTAEVDEVRDQIGI